MKRHYHVTIASLALLTGGCATGLKEQIRQLGFQPVALPSTEYKPGQVIDNTTPQRRIFRADPDFTSLPVCAYGDYIGTPNVETDDGATVMASEKLSTPFDITANYKDQLQAVAGFQYIKSITVSLSNVKVETLSAAAVYSNLTKQTAGCTEALKAFKADSTKHLGFLQRVLKADGTYTVSLNAGANLTLSATQQLIRNVGAKLGANPALTSGNSIAGTGLYWGVAPPDPALVKLSPSVALDVVQSPYKTTDNRSNVRCNGRSPCSPDGKWWAAETDITVSASKVGDTLSNPKIDCDDSGTGACVFQSPTLFETSGNGSSITARVYTYSVPVHVRLEATESGPP